MGDDSLRDRVARWRFRRRLQPLGVLKVAPGEVLVIECDRELSMQQAAYIKEQLASSGLRIAVISRPLRVVAVQGSDGGSGATG